MPHYIQPSFSLHWLFPELHVIPSNPKEDFVRQRTQLHSSQEQPGHRDQHPKSTVALSAHLPNKGTYCTTEGPTSVPCKSPTWNKFSNLLSNQKSL